MVKNKKSAFTLIELIAVLVIMAILALIVTPLVMNIIRKARVAADKRSIDAYGRSIELAIAGYLLDTGKFPTDVRDLTIEYSGNKVECSTTQLNSDSSVYLTGCTVAGRNVEYSYGIDKMPPAPTYTSYSIGDEVSYNNVDYYVIANSGKDEASVKLLKKTPLTVNEVNTYGGVGTANNHVNMYATSNTSESYYQTAYNNSNGSGGVVYYSSSNCIYNEISGCKNDYDESEIKYIVDSWSAENVPNGLQQARLITKKELEDTFEFENFEYKPCGDSCGTVLIKQRCKTDWVGGYNYWTMSVYDNSSDKVWIVDYYGGISDDIVNGASGPTKTVRPVIVLDKSVITTN